MIIDHCFMSPIAAEDLTSINNSAICEYAVKLKSQSSGRLCSNVKGWQSEDIDFANTHPEILKLYNEILERTKFLHETFRLKIPAEIKIMNMWININSLGSFNRPHIHQNSVFSGVYYVSTSGDDGNIVFQHPAINHQYHLTPNHVGEYNNFTSARFSVVPNTGKLVIFPAWLQHYVEPNTQDADRISISFNTNFNTALS